MCSVFMTNKFSTLLFTKETKSSARLTELDALRGIAAVMVLLLHFKLFKFGSSGVDLFFIISGFVIFMSIERYSTLKDFWRSRFIRLFPSYWLSILIALLSRYLFYGSYLPTDFKFIVGNLTMLQPLFRTTNLVGTYWTLYVELTFYISISLIWYFNKIKNIQILILIGLIIIIVFNSTHLILGDKYKLYTRFFVVVRATIPLASNLQLFSAGIIFYLCYKNGIDIPKMLLLLISIVATAISHSDSVSINHSMDIFERVACDTVFYAVFMLVIKDKLKCFQFKPLTVIGTISYPLYLIHLSFGTDLRDYLISDIGNLNATAAGILGSFLLAFAITYWFDIPLRKRFKPKTSEIH